MSRDEVQERRLLDARLLRGGAQCRGFEGGAADPLACPPRVQRGVGWLMTGNGSRASSRARLGADRGSQQLVALPGAMLNQ